MTAVVAPAAPARSHHVVLQLAVAEGRRLVRHPVVLVGLALCLTGLVVAARTTPEESGSLPVILLSGAGQWPLAVAALLAANLTAVRPRRYGTPELEDTTLTGPGTRTLGLLAATGALTLVAFALLAVAAVTFEAWNGIPVRFAEGFASRHMHITEFLQGPLAVTTMAVLGVVLGRWVPTRLLAPLLLLPGLVGFLHTMWRFDAPAWRFAPIMVHEQQLAWVQVTPSGGYSIIGGFAIGDLAWHLVYLAGVTVLLAVAAVARSGWSRPLGIAAGSGLALAVAGGTLQLP